MRFWTDQFAMTPDQELLFQQQIRKTTGKYFWAAALFVLLFQIYNIAYTLHYTGFQLGSRASRVYMVLYICMLSFCLISLVLGFLWSFVRKSSDLRLLRLYSAFSFFLLLWSVCITLYDQRVSDNISIYITSSMYIAGLIYLRPRISVPIFIFCEAVLMGGFLWMHLEGIKDTYGFCVNSIGLTIVALFISLYRWSSLRRDFLNHQEIQQKSKIITEQNEKLDFIANHDALTGLWNRNYLNQWTAEFFSAKEQKSAAVFILDIDHFKQYNDTFGHMAGDECLRQVARSLNAMDGNVFRFGGEEFLYILPCEDPDQASRLGESLCRRIESLQIPAAKPGAYLTISVGYSMGSMENDAAFQRLLREADDALYHAKSSGRNRSVKYDVSLLTPETSAP